MKTLTASSAHPLLPRRRSGAHKGDAGRLLIVAGSRGMVGAGVLACMGAVYSGVGLVRWALVKSQLSSAVEKSPPEIMTQPLSEQNGMLALSAWTPLLKSLKTYAPDVVALGPGLGQAKAITTLVSRFLSQQIPVVVDADGLNALSSLQIKRRRAPWIITPHPGELARLFKTSTRTIQNDREGWVLKAARKFDCVCLLKGQGTLISNGKKVWKNSTGNPAMASAGMGDVLTGVIASLWAQYPVQDSQSAFNAAALGAFLHGSAGDEAFKLEQGLSVRASQVALTVPRAIRRLKSKQQ